MPRRGPLLKYVRGTTRVAGVIGDPVEHSLSPVLHNAAYAELGLDWVYVAYPVRAGEGAAAVAAMRALGVAGLSVTMPHKASVVGALDRLTPIASRLGAVNTITAMSGELVGDSTDGAGFVDALVDGGFEPGGRRAVVLGAGGAARAVTLALGEAGASEVVVFGRKEAATAECASLAGAAGRAGSPESTGGSSVQAVNEAAAAADLVVNATPLGMAAGDGIPFDLDTSVLHSGQLVVDLIYAPAMTVLLSEARKRGATTINGMGMLIHQAARQVTIWTGRQAPLEAMSAAALGALAGERRR